MKVFVYGTLKAGMPNNYLLASAQFMGKDEAPGVLYSGSSFPMAVPCPNEERKIQGEVYDVDGETLQRLDALEGHPRMYTRTPVRLSSGKKASIYYWQLDTQRLTFLPAGVWPPSD